MYQINQASELDQRTLSQILNAFVTTDLPKLSKYRNYYDGKQAIMHKQATDNGKPCNKVVVNYCDNIVSNYLGYLSGIPIRYDNKDSDISDVIDILRYNDVHTEDSEYLRQALIYGIAYELQYADEDGKQRMCILDSRECIPIYRNTVEGQLAYVVRFYHDYLWDEATKDNYIVEVYSDREVITYRTNSAWSSFEEIDRYNHYYQQVPINVFDLNPDNKSIFDNIISLQDAYNNLLSGEVDDFDSFADAYLLLKGCTADPEQLDAMKTNRVLMMDTDCDASYLTKSISDTQIQNMLQNINEQIHKISHSPDFSDEKFLAQSGIAMRYKLVGFEDCASSIEAMMRKALTRRIENLSYILSLSDTEEIWREVDISFVRNLPVDMSESATVVNQLRGVVSDRTLLSLLPFVTDIDAEMEEVAKEKELNMSMYRFGVADDEDEQAE